MGQRVIRVYKGLGKTSALRDGVKPTKRERRGEIKSVDLSAREALRRKGYVLRNGKLVKIRKED